MKVKGFLRNAYTAVLMLIALLLASCDVFGMDDAESSAVPGAAIQVSEGQGGDGSDAESSQKLAYLSLRVTDADGNQLCAAAGSGGSAARTALPRLTAEDFSLFTLWGRRDGENQYAELWRTSGTSPHSELASARVAVAEGHWQFRLVAQKGGASYTGHTARREVVAGQEDELSFTLELSKLGSDGTGGVSVTVAFPASGVTRVTAGLYAADGTAVAGYADETLAMSGGSAVYAKDGISAGSYTVVFKFYAEDSGGTVLLGTWAELAEVAGGVTSVSDGNTIPALDVTYPITYNWNSGSLTSGETAQGSYSRHNAVTLPTEAQVTRTGYTFAGWYDNSSLTGTAVTQIPADSTGARSFWAKWNPASYTVCYHKNTSASDTAANSTQTLTYDTNGALKTLSSLGWSRTDATFVGWATSANASAATYTDGQSGTLNLTGVPDGTADLYAVWKYTVSFNGNKGASHSTAVSGSTAAQTVTGYATNLALAANGFTHAGYTFAGWNSKADGTGTSYAASTTYTFGANTNLYAQWTANTYTVTVSTGWAKGATTTTTVTATFDAALPTLTTTNPPSNHPVALGSFKRCGYTLEGFYDAATGGTKYYDADGASVKSWDKTSAATLYAHWTALGTVLTSGSSSGMGLVDSVYVFSQDLSFTTGTAGDSGITIGEASVSFYIEEGVTVTATGKAGGTGQGGGAGIHVPSGKTLNLYGYGTLNATGGNGGNAANGESNQKTAYITKQSGGDKSQSGGGGAGGVGAGGGGAGIGTPGANGGAGGSGGTPAYTPDINGDTPGGDGGAGSAGGSGAWCGTIQTRSPITVNATAGSGGSAGTGGALQTGETGCQKTSNPTPNYGANDSGSDWGSDFSAGFGGTGGGGGAGTAGANIGTGGAGGGGGGGGGAGGIDKADDRNWRNGYGGSGGSSGGGDGVHKADTGGYEHLKGKGGAGGAQGSGGIPSTVYIAP